MDASRGGKTADTPGATTERQDERQTEYLLCIAANGRIGSGMPEGGDLVIGSGPDVGLSLDDPLVSRAHAQLMRVPDGLRLVDLGSRHGTQLNGEKLRRTAAWSARAT